MKRKTSNGFRWGDLSDAHRKAIAYFSRMKGGFVQSYTPCKAELLAYVQCTTAGDNSPCIPEVEALNMCAETAQQFDYKAAKTARKLRKYDMRAAMTTVFKAHPRTRRFTPRS